jgi:hypothetical protein
MIRAIVAVAFVALLGAVPLQLDSQIVLQRYELQLDDVKTPKTQIFSYVVSQAGPPDIEQRHRLYRSGLDVRDETITVDGVPLKRKTVHVTHRDDRYAIARVAPRTSTYSFVFLHTIKRGTHVDYEYEAKPLLSQQSGFVVERVTIDGEKFLPRVIHFRTSGAAASGTGALEYAPFGDYWMPVAASVTATVGGRSARERISFGDYRFPDSLPQSTFQTPKPLPRATLPPV